MKSKKNIIVLVIILIMIIATIALIIYIPKSKLIKEMVENNVTDYYFCEGIRCKNKDFVYETKQTVANCEVCTKEIKSETTNIEKLCAKCSKSTKRCIYCGEKITEEKIAENNRKKLQLAKYNKINIAENKICAIENTNNIAILTKDYSNKENNNSILVIYNMLENKEVQKIDLNADYILHGKEITFDILTEVDRGMALDVAKKIYNEQEKEKLDYEAQGRLFNLDDKIILITPEKNKNFVYNIKTKELNTNIKSQSATYGDENYYYIVDEKDGKTYYYFENYDLYTNNIENLELEKYIIDSNDFNQENLISPKVIVTENGYTVSFYNEKYGKNIIKKYDQNKQEVNEKNSNEEEKTEEIFETKTRIVLYNIKTNEEIWSYDKELNDAIYKELIGM